MKQFGAWLGSPGQPKTAPKQLENSLFGRLAGLHPNHAPFCFFGLHPLKTMPHAGPQLPTRSSLRPRLTGRVWLCLTLISLAGCFQQRYEPANWESKAPQTTKRKPPVAIVPSSGTSLPADRSATTTLPPKAGLPKQTQAGANSTLPGRGAERGNTSLPSRQPSRVPDRAGTTLPARQPNSPAGQTTLPGRNPPTGKASSNTTLPGRDSVIPGRNSGTTLPGRR